MFRMNTGANKQKSKPHADNRSALERAPPILGAFCILLLVIGCAYLVQQADLKLDSQAARATAEKRSRDVAALISSSMNVRLNLTSSLSAFVTTHRKFSPEEFDRFASLLKGDLNGIISLQLAPGGIVTYLTDLERNRKALGHNLLADPKRRAIAEKSIRERSYIIAGPIDLIQGGRAIIARRPIFFPDSTSKTEIFWGFATVLIDIDTLLNDALVAELQDDFDVAIRGKDGLGAKGEVFAGEPSVFDAASAVANIPLPNASWQIAVAKKPEQTPSGLLHSPWYWVFSSMIAIEPPRVYRRLHILRGWSYELTKTIFPGSPRAGGSASY